jgi:hypothetical protein
LPEGVEESLSELSGKFLATILPVAMGGTWKVDELNPFLQLWAQKLDSKDMVCLSGVAATIGTGPEEWLSESLLAGDTQASQIISAFAEESADLSLQFFARLLAEEAEDDGCELSPPIFLSEPDDLNAVFSLLDASQEGISLDSAHHIIPRFTRVALFFWTPIKKKKRHSALSSTKPS